MNLTRNFYINLFFIVTLTLFFVSAFYVTNSVAKEEMDLYGDMLEDDMINPFEGDEEALQKILLIFGFQDIGAL